MSLKKQAVSGVIWTFAQQFSVQIINFGVQIILARLLMPEMFGLIAMLNVFISIGQLLMDGGMTSSLIRTKNPDQLDYSTVFLTNIFVSTGIYILIFLFAPFIGRFYNQPILSDILKVYALSFVIRSFVAVHIAKLTKEMNFKTQMRLQVPSTIVGAFVGLAMANLGYGVWSLVWLNLTQTIVFTIQSWVFIKWRPSFVFNRRRFKYHFNFGYKMTLSGLLDSIYNDAYNIIIGKFFSPTTVGFYSQAETLRLFPVKQLSMVMGKVTYPLFANLTTDEKLKSAYKQTMRLMLFLVVPLMLYLIVIADELFLFVFGEKWMPAVPYFQILAIASIFRPIGVYNLNILKVKGRSDLFLRLEVVKKIIGVFAIVVTLPFGILPLVYSLSITSVFFAFINAFYSGKLILYSVGEQLKDIYRIFVIGIISSSLTFFAFEYLEFGFPIYTLLLSCIFYLVVYATLIFLFERQIVHTLKGLLKK
ncbi:MAG: lipopolysaccharide biosynthesis protein [Sphingobacterium sp.]